MQHVIPDAMEEDDTVSYSSSVRSGPAGFYRPGNAYRFAPSGHSVSSEGDVSLKRDREREGRCSECGVQTHEFRRDPVTGQSTKVALTVENEVHRGRCLFCHPFTPSHFTPRERSTRSLNSVSSHGSGGIHPDYIDSSVASTVTNSVVEETMLTFERESADLLDVLTAMRRFPNERRIQERGLEKLWIQSWDDENSSAIGRVGGITTILSAMNSFRSSHHLQQCGCEALQNLALNEYNRDAICEQGGIQAIVQAMNRHQDVVGVQQCGCTALANLAASRDHHLDIANAGGLHAIMNAARNFQDEESVLRVAYQALRTMGYDPNRHGRTAAQQGVEQQQPQQQPQRQLHQGGQQEEDVIRLDQHGFPIN